MMKRLAFVALPGLAACVGSDPADPCGAKRYKSFEGQPLSALEARLPADSFKVDRPLPDGTVTAEDIYYRVRVSVDKSDTILRVGCG